MQKSQLQSSVRGSLIPHGDQLQPPSRNLKNRNSIQTTEFSLYSRYHDKSYPNAEKEHTWQWKFFRWMDTKFSNDDIGEEQRQFSTAGIAPESNWLIFWNLTVVFSILYHIFEIPITIFFTQAVYITQFNTLGGLLINYATLLILFINMIVIIPNTRFYQNGNLICKRQKIFKRYIEIQFWFDLICWVILLIYILVDNYYQLIYLKIFFYLSLLTLYRTDKMILLRMEMLHVRYAFYRVCKLLVLLTFAVTWLSSIFFIIDYRYYINKHPIYYPQHLWLTYSNCTNNLDLVVHQPWYVWLNYAAYWTLQSITMVGYGDMTPKNPEQTLFCNITVLIGTIFYAFFISTIWQIIGQARQLQDTQRIHQKQLKLYYKQNLQQTNNELLFCCGIQCNSQKSQQRIQDTTQIRNKIGSYMFEIWNYQNLGIDHDQNIHQMIEQCLSVDLKNELIISYRLQFFRKIPLFMQILESQDNLKMFKQTTNGISQRCYRMNEIIYDNNSINISIKMYLLLRGIIRLHYKKSFYSIEIVRQNIQDIQQYHNFGVKGFLNEQRNDHQVKAITFCKISELQKQHFKSTIKMNTSLYVNKINIDLLQEMFKQLQDQVKLNHCQKLIGQKCMECGDQNHTLLQCQRVLTNIRNIINIKEIKSNNNNNLNFQTKTSKMYRRKYKRKFIQSQKQMNHSALIQKQKIEVVHCMEYYFIQHNIV